MALDITLAMAKLGELFFRARLRTSKHIGATSEFARNSAIIMKSGDHKVVGLVAWL
jgi:hypothetical protein